MRPGKLFDWLSELYAELDRLRTKAERLAAALVACRRETQSHCWWITSPPARPSASSTRKSSAYASSRRQASPRLRCASTRNRPTPSGSSASGSCRRCGEAAITAILRPGPHSATWAVGRGHCGSSNSSRYSMMVALCASSAIPVNFIVVPGANSDGFRRNLSSLFRVHRPRRDLRACEY